MKRVYLAGPLTAPTCSYISNVHAMIQVEWAIRKAGFSCFNPALDILTGMAIGGMTYDDYFNNNAAWIPAADALFLMPGWEHSAGCCKERQIAAMHNIPAFMNITDLTAWGKEQGE